MWCRIVVRAEYKQFPPFFSTSARRSGLVVINVVVAAYMFVGIVIVCERFFLPALDIISTVRSYSRFRQSGGR